MNYGTIKNVGNGQVDVQLTGSARVLRNVQISAQVSWNTLAPGTRVLVDSVNGRPVVLHTVTDVPQLYTTSEQQTYAAAGVYGPENALLADGSVPLTGDLSVTPGVKIDGYDISVLGQTIDNLQAADSVARTGYTVMTHASHLVETIGEDDTQLKIRHDLFIDKETLVVSNTAGEVEFMRVIGQAVPTVDDHGALCYLYTVTRRTSTSPAGLYTGWAAATLVNGLTSKGYIAFDARENRPATPSMRFVLHTDIATNATEHIVRVGSLNNILDYTTEDFGFAVGRLTTADKYLAYSYADNRFRIRGADFAGEDETGTETFRIWGIAEGGRVPGDYRFGPLVGGHQEWTSESQRLSIFNGADEVIYFSPTESRFRNMIWAGSEAGPQIGIGELDGQGIIVARNALDVAQFVVRTQTDGVYVFAGNPKPQANWMEFDGGFFTVDGTIRARALEIIGQAVVGDDTSEIIIRDPADPRRYGHIKPHYLAGYSVDSTDTQYLSTLIAWAPAVLEAQPGSGVFRTWIAGESFFGDWRYGHFRIERNGRVGLFNGETPKVYLDSSGSLYANDIIALSGSIGGWILDSTTLSSVNGEVQLSSINGLNIVSDDSGMEAVSNTNSVNWYDELGFVNRTARIYGSTGIAEHTLILESDGRNLDFHGKVSLYATGGAARSGTVLLRAEGNDLETDGAQINISATGAAGGATINAVADEFNVTGAASVDLTDAATAVISNVLTLAHNSSGTPAAYFGGSLPLNLKSTTTPDRPAASIDWLWADPTHGTETAAMIIGTAYNGNVSQVAKFGGTLGTVLNEDGNAWCDLRVESDNYNALFIDASNDSIAIMNHASGKVSFFAAAPVAKPTGVAVTAAGIHAALVSLGLIAA